MSQRASSSCNTMKCTPKMELQQPAVVFCLPLTSARVTIERQGSGNSRRGQLESAPRTLSDRKATPHPTPPAIFSLGPLSLVSLSSVRFPIISLGPSATSAVALPSPRAPKGEQHRPLSMVSAAPAEQRSSKTAVAAAAAKGGKKACGRVCLSRSCSASREASVG